MFSQKKAVLIFQETKTPKKIPIFSKESHSYILGNGNSKRIFLIFQEVELSYISENGNPKKLLIFQKVNFCS